MKSRLRLGVLLALIAVVMVAGGSVAVAQMAPVGEIPFLQQWSNSGHADIGSPAFTRWNADGAIPVGCAKCHSTPGYLDFLGMDGSARGVVNNPSPLGTPVQCIACHNDAARLLTHVTFPSGEVVTGFEESARCAECHQGRTSKVQVDAEIERRGATDEDTVVGEIGFINIHYYAAAATLFGSQAKGGYEYDGFPYMGRFIHVEGYDTCADCHDPHSLQLKVGECAGCHAGVESVEDVREIRMAGSLMDYDGDGNMTEGIRDEISGLQEKLLQGIRAYAREVSGRPIGYNSERHPYWFIDTNDDGMIEASEAVSANRYQAYTPRLLKAAYNYQVSKKDPGAYAHNAKYIIQLVFDSIVDLNTKLANPVNIDAGSRFDAGHFEFTSTAWRYWDAQGAVPATCSKCHTSDGLPFYLQNNRATRAQAPSNSMECRTCHNSSQNFGLQYAGPVTFPSGAVASLDDVRANLCMECHQGRTSTTQVNALIQRVNVGDNTVSTQLTFQNIHYFAAGATLFGTQVKGGYEYAGRTYAGRFQHVESHNTCIECHDAHALNVRVETCTPCHTGVQSQADLRNIRFGSPADYDGDGNVTEGIAFEIEGMQQPLLQSIQSYAANTAGAAIGYNPHSHPYWFVDDNQNGVIDAGETTRYTQWTPTLLRAAYNYQFSKKDTGAFTHNADYVLQLLYDSLEAVGGKGATAGMVRP